jgi:RecA/RadA recombinase
MKKKIELADESEKHGSASLLSDFLKSNKEDHFNFEDSTEEFKVSTGSLILDIEVGGGVLPCIIRNSGVSGGGKTSCALTLLKNFLSFGDGKDNLGVYIKAEGRLSKQVIERSGVKFVDDADDWKDGTCFVYKSNVYESVAKMIKMLVTNNPQKKKYFFIIDSMDALIPKGDKDKDFTETLKVSGGAAISSHFLRTMSLPFSVGGHYCVMISQVRSTVSINQYAKPDPKLTNASGGQALNHYPDWSFEFQPRFKADLISDSKGNTIGHWAKIIFRKSPNEKEGKEIRYPIRHNQKDGNSVWKEYEIADVLVSWEMLKKAGAWLSPAPELIEEVKTATNREMPKQIQGQDNLMKYLESEPEVSNFLFKKFQLMLSC